MRMSLTMINETMRMLLAGETETGNAEVQPVRDNRFKATDCRGDGSIRLLSHFMLLNDNSELCNASKKPLCRRQSSLLTVKWICPFHAEPIQSIHRRNL
jgi:hypothetical protein